MENRQPGSGGESVTGNNRAVTAAEAELYASKGSTVGSGSGGLELRSLIVFNLSLLLTCSSESKRCRPSRIMSSHASIELAPCSHFSRVAKALGSVTRDPTTLTGEALKLGDSVVTTIYQV